MTKKEVIKKIEQLDKQIYCLEKEIRIQKKQNKIQKFEALEEARGLKEKILSKKSSAFKIALISGICLIVSAFSLIIGGVASAVAVGLCAGFGALSAGGAALAGALLKNKLKYERKLIIVEDKIAVLTNESFDNLGLEELQDEKEKYLLILDYINQEIEKKQSKKKSDKSIDILKAVQLGANTNRFDDGNEYDASTEAVLNYQKKLAKNSSELTK